MKTLAGVLVVGTLGGCQILLDGPPRPLLSVEEVLAMHQAGVPAPVIAAKVDVSRGVGPLTALEIVRLKEQGMDERLMERLVAASGGGDRTVYYQAPYDTDGRDRPADTAAHPDEVQRRRIYTAD